MTTDMSQDLTKITLDLCMSPRLPLPSSITSGDIEEFGLEIWFTLR